MAEGYAKSKGANAISAGTIPASHVNPLVVQAMDEIAVDISDSRPKPITDEMIDESDTVVLTDANLMSAMPKNILKRAEKKLVVWSVPDPQGQPIEVVRFVRDQIQRNVDSLLEKEELKA